MVLSYAIIALTCMSQGGASMSLDEVVQANTSSLAGIRSLAVHVKEFQTEPAESVSDNALKLTVEYTYRMQGKEERVTTDLLFKPPAPGGDRPGHVETYNGPAGFREIIGYDPAHPSKLGEYSLSRAQGTIAPQKTDEPPFPLNPKSDLLFVLYKKPKYLSLRDLIATTRTARLVATPANSPHHCYEIAVEWPESRRLICVDPAANFMIRRVESSRPDSDEPRSPSFVEVVSFQDCGDGIFIPTRIEATSQLTGGRSLKVLNTCEVLSCNQPIPADEFRVDFPDWLCVVDQRSGKIHYWGPDDKPRLTFSNAEEHRRWRQPRLTQARRAQRDPGFPWSIVMGAITVIIAVTATLWTRYRSRGELAERP